MASFDPAIMMEIRNRFAHVDTCPFQGERIFFENAGGALTLNSVVETSARMAAIPDNQGRDNVASAHLMEIINKAKSDVKCFFNAKGGEVFVGESGTELIFRLVRSACLASPDGGNVVASTFEHPATRSAATRWAEITNRELLLAAHDNNTGTITPQAYQKVVTPQTRVATILHTSPVTGICAPIKEIAAEIRKISPHCIIIVDGIQHAAHGDIDLSSLEIDGYVISPYKVFSRHGYGIAWVSDQLKQASHDHLIDAPNSPWEMGTRDTGSYATFSGVVEYFSWLGGHFSQSDDMRTRIEAATHKIHDHEQALTQAMLKGIDNHKGLEELPNTIILGGKDNPGRRGLVSFANTKISSSDLVRLLGERGVRVHIRKDDHYSGNILTPLGMKDCVRVSMCHYNSEDEVAEFLSAIQEIVEG